MLTETEPFIERLVAGGFEREHAEYAVALIVEESLPLEGMVALLIAQANPTLTSIVTVQPQRGGNNNGTS